MSSDSRDKVIYFQPKEQRALEESLRGLVDARDDDELDRRASAWAASPGPLVNAFLSQLHTTDPRLVGALGRVARHLDAAAIVPALQRVARNPRGADPERMAAILILTRFLDETVDDWVMGTLRDPNAIARASLRLVLTESRQNRAIWLEYFEQMEEQPDDVAFAVMDMMLEMDGEASVEGLRILAQSPRQSIADEALRRLGSLHSPAAVRALAALLPTLPPTARALAERNLQKLRLAGIANDASPADGGDWRALVTPVDGDGAQLVWLARPHPDDAAYQQALGLLVDDATGLLRAFGGERIAATDMPLPPREPVGALYAIAAEPLGGHLLLLEAPLAYARQVVTEALTVHHAGGHPTPPLYRLLNPFLWDGPALPPDVPPVPTNATSAAQPAPDGLRRQAVALLRHPAFAGWRLKDPALNALAAQWQQAGGDDTTYPEDALLGIIANSYDASSIQRHRQRLLRMGVWLHWAGEAELARMAATLADSLQGAAPPAHPYFQYLAALGLEVARQQARHTADTARPTD